MLAVGGAGLSGGGSGFGTLGAASRGLAWEVWAMLLVGFGAVGAAMRKRKTTRSGMRLAH